MPTLTAMQPRPYVFQIAYKGLRKDYEITFPDGAVLQCKFINPNS